MARRRFFIDHFEENSAVLSGDDAQHLARVLRAEAGQRFELSDSRSVRLAEIAEINSRKVRFRLLEPIDAPLPPVRVTLIASLIKFDRFEWMIEKATELGVEGIRPVAAARSESGLLQAAQKRVERWRRIARESSQQSRRVRIPEIAAPERLDPAAAASDFRRRLFLDEERAGTPLAKSLAGADAADPVAILIGPEGGWTPAEREHLQACWTTISLGPQILRAETAAIAALSVVMSLFG